MCILRLHSGLISSSTRLQTGCINKVLRFKALSELTMQQGTSTLRHHSQSQWLLSGYKTCPSLIWYSRNLFVWGHQGWIAVQEVSSYWDYKPPRYLQIPPVMKRTGFKKWWNECKYLYFALDCYYYFMDQETNLKTHNPDNRRKCQPLRLDDKQTVSCRWTFVCFRRLWAVSINSWCPIRFFQFIDFLRSKDMQVFSIWSWRKWYLSPSNEYRFHGTLD